MSLLCLLTLLGGACRTDNKTAVQGYLQSGLRYFEHQKFEEASIQFRNALKRDPRAWEPRYYLALSALKLGRWQEASRDLNTVIELQPSFAPARLEMAELLALAQKLTEAREQVNAVLALNPKDVRAQALLGKFYLVEKDYPRAVEQFEKAKELAPQDPALWSACGLAKVSAHQPALAEKDFRRALELDPSSAEANRNLANLLRLTGRMSEVEPILRQGLKVNPRSLELHMVLADFYFQQGRLAEIEDWFAQMRGHSADFPDLRLQIGDFWLWHNELGRAVKEYETAEAETPSPLAEKKLISAYLTLGRIADADRLNQPLLKKNPKDLEARAFHGALAYLRGDFNGAVQELPAVLKEEPHSLLANYYIGLSWMGLNRTEQAKAAFTECVRLNDQFLQAYSKLGELALLRGDWSVGTEYARKVVQLNPRSLDGYLLLAQAYMLKRDFAAADRILAYAKGLTASPPAELHEVAARLAVLKHDDASANAEFEQALARTSRPLDVLTHYADFQVESGRTGVAIERVKRWMEGTPAQPSSYELLVRLYLQQRDWANAEAAASKALALAPQRWIAHFLLGEVYRQKGQVEEALAHYDEAIRRSPGEIPPYVVAGNLLMERGQSEKAKPYFEAALRQDPDSPQAQHALARCYAERGENLNVALSMAQDLKRRFPEDPYISDMLGWVYYQKAAYQLALQELRPTARALPENAVVQFHLGMTYVHLGEAAQGRQALKRAVRLGLVPPALAAVAEQTLSRLTNG